MYNLQLQAEKMVQLYALITSKDFFTVWGCDACSSSP